MTSVNIQLFPGCTTTATYTNSPSASPHAPRTPTNPRNPPSTPKSSPRRGSSPSVNSGRPSVNSVRVIVIGAGVLGATVARELATAGGHIKVTVLEAEDRAGMVASDKSFGWVNAAFKRPKAYFELSRLGVRAWREYMAPQCDAVTLGGCVRWFRRGVDDAETVEWFERESKQALAWGLPGRMLVGADEVRELEPEVRAAGGVADLREEDVVGVAMTDGSNCDVHRAAETALQAAVDAGATVLYRHRVQQLSADGERPRVWVQSRDSGKTMVLECDRVVLAAGCETKQLAAQLGVHIPLVDSPGVLVTTKPMRRILRGVALTPAGHVLQLPDGRVIFGAHFGGDPNTAPSIEYAQELRDKVLPFVPALAEAEIDRVTMGWRPMPVDERPIIGWIKPGVYATVMHSGYSLAPAVGLLVRHELVEPSLSFDVLRDFRPDRFHTQASKL